MRSSKAKSLRGFEKELTLTLGGRNFAIHPYSPDEKRIVQWLMKLSPDVGGGEDPIGFFMASYEYLIAERKELKQQIAALKLDNDRLYGLMNEEDAKDVS